MIKFVNKYLRNFKPYKLASHKIWNIEPSERKRILKLDWNEATIPPSPKVSERLLSLINNEPCYNLYPSTYNDGLMSLLSSYVGLPKDNIQYFASSDSLHEYIAKLYISVGDPILILGPTYDNFRLTAEVCGAKLNFFYISDDMYFDKSKFVDEIHRVDPSLVYICNPNNPTGTLHSVDFIENLLANFGQTLFLIDEAYVEFSGVSAKELVLKYENLLISRTMSKAFALANFRFGYLLASKKNIEYISKIRNPKNITTFTQEAVIGALSDVEYMMKYVKEVNQAKSWFVQQMDKLSDIVSCYDGFGNFVLIDCKQNERKLGLLNYLENRDIFVRNVSQTKYLEDNCIRITVGLMQQMKYVFDSIESYIKNE